MQTHEIQIPRVSAHSPALVFDFGGVLIDWNPRYLYRKLFRDDQAIENFLQESRFYEWILEQDAGLDFEEAVARMCDRYPQHCAMFAAYDQRYEETIRGPIHASVEILRALKDGGHPLYALSNWPAEKFRLVSHKFPFFEWFDDMVISGNVHLAKPDPRIFELLLERIGRPAGECVFIDDSAKNIAAAQELGFQTILFRSADQMAQELTAVL